MRLHLFGPSIGLAILLTATSAQAQRADDEAPPAVVNDVTACRAIQDEKARLDCYDRTVGALSSQVQARDVVVLNRAEVRRTRRSLFGFNLPRLPFFGGGGGGGEDDIDEITSTITSASPLANGRYRVVLEDGAVWRTTEAVVTIPRAGRPITLKKAMMGSYFMKVGNGRSVRAMRIN